MMRNLLFFIAFLVISISLNAQEQEQDSLFQQAVDSLTTQELAEVVLISNSSENFLEEIKALGSLDSYLKKSNAINMVKRGSYAWEPLLNGMETERSVITVDGMRIYAACTDKMDPITSYVENSNFSRAKVSEGPSGAEHGGTIAGSIDLKRRKSGFTPYNDFTGNTFAGFESNNKQQIYGTALSYTSKKFFADADFTFRDASNYKAGHQSGAQSEVDFSQYRKYNLSFIGGYKINDNQEIEASAIYDHASDIGYPGLTMDVSLAKAFIGSVEYRYRNPFTHIDLWETKTYFNTVTHVMDDSHRKDVPIRMDMPGWSKTQGFYSRLNGSKKKHHFRATLSAHRNNSYAEMTMFPNDPNESDMFMLTWPDINTVYGGIDVEDHIQFNSRWDLKLSGGIALHHNKIRSEFGLNSLQTFYPDLKDSKTRVLKNLNAKMAHHHKKFTHKIGVGYGERAPSVSEGYGFYLLNTNDNYDYIGNPNLANEKSLNVNWSTKYEQSKFDVSAQANYFHIIDYIVGKPRPGIPPMNVLADGIKVYEQLKYAKMFNTGINANYYISNDWSLAADASYRYGQGDNGTRLPLIQPFSYGLNLRYQKETYFIEASVEGSTKNRNSIEFGETKKHGFLIANLSASKTFELSLQELTVKIGAENIFDKYYSTFDDWFGIPRMGRNIFANVIYEW